MDLQRRLLAADGGGAQAQPMTLCCCCCVRCCPDTRGLRQTTYEIMNTGAVEASLNTPVLERRWTFFAGTAVEVLVLSMIIGNCVFVLGDAETVVREEEDGSTVGSNFVRTLVPTPECHVVVRSSAKSAGHVALITRHHCLRPTAHIACKTDATEVMKILCDACWRCSQVNDFLPFEIISTIFFTLEYAVRCWSCSIEPTFRDWRGRLRWARQPLQIIDLICLVAFYIDIFNILRFAPQHQRMAVRLAWS